MAKNLLPREDEISSRHRECPKSVASALREPVPLPHQHWHVCPPCCLCAALLGGKPAAQPRALQESLVLKPAWKICCLGKRRHRVLCDFLRTAITFPLRNCLVPKPWKKPSRWCVRLPRQGWPTRTWNLPQLYSRFHIFAAAVVSRPSITSQDGVCRSVLSEFRGTREAPR